MPEPTLTRRLFSRRALAAAAVLAFSAAAGAVIAVNAAPHAGTQPTPVSATLAVTSASPGPHSPARHGYRRPLRIAVVRATSRETGLSLQTIREDLRNGETLDQIAGSKASAVENDVLAALKTRLDKAVDAHKITQQQETNRLNLAKQRIESLMEKQLHKPAP
ncbi:MAG: hypothetical protein JOY80_05740 [Candidatus Dormibacteraeota bacterium]|nr:hypothetical protein [Candidatus Dormibacteraeota bacterium]